MPDPIEQIAAALDTARAPSTEAPAPDTADDDTTPATEPDADATGDDTDEHADDTATDADASDESDDEDDGDSASGDDELTELEFKRVNDAQRAFHAEREKVRQLEAQLAAKNSQQQPDNAGTLTFDDVAEVIDGNSANAISVWDQALERPDALQLMTHIIAATQPIDPSLAEEMRDARREFKATQTEQATAAVQHYRHEVATTTVNEFYTDHPDAKDLHQDISQVIGSTPLMQQMMESGNDDLVYFAMDAARLAAENAALKAKKPDAPDTEQVRKDRGKARGLETGKGPAAPKPDPSAGNDRTKELINALGSLGALRAV